MAEKYPHLDELTEKQRTYVELVFTHPEMTQLEAYNKAGYKSIGDTGRVEAKRALKHPKVKSYLDWLKIRNTNNCVHTAEEALQEVEKIAFKEAEDELTHKTKLASLREYLDRLQGKPTQRQEIKKVVLSRELTDEELARIVTGKQLPESESLKAIPE